MLTKSFWGVVPVLDLAWQAYYLVGAYASADLTDPLEVARLAGVDALTGLGNASGSVEGLLTLWTTSRRLQGAAKSIGRFGWHVGWFASAADLLLLGIEFFVRTWPESAGLRAEDRDAIVGATAVCAIGKGFTVAGAFLAASGALGAVLTGIGTVLDYAGRIAAETIGRDARVAALYDALEQGLHDAARRLDEGGAGLGGGGLVMPADTRALRALRTYGGFRAVDVDAARRYGLLADDGVSP